MDETAQRKLQRTLAEYSLARVEYHNASIALSTRSQTSGETQCPESLAEQSARARLLTLHDQISQLEASFWLGRAAPIAG
jgi:hypothetical protein